MTGPADAALLAAVAIGCVRGSAVLGAARWPRRSPGAAILLWQALRLGGGLAAVGALIGIGFPARVMRGGHGLGGGLAAVGALIEIGLPAGSSSVANGVVRVARMSSHGSLFPAGQPVLPAFLRLGRPGAGRGPLGSAF